jgi:predicted amidohydrolase
MKTIVAAAQYPITYHLSFDDWRSHTTRWVDDAVRQKAQLLLFPEYAVMELVSLLPLVVQQDLRQQVRALEQYREACWELFAQLAQRHQVIIVAPSYPVIEGDKIFNRAAVFSSKGMVGYQDKQFMTRFEAEDWGIDAAPGLLTVFEADWGKFGIQICYDIEFPLGAQVLNQHGATLILAPSCTETIRGATRVHVGARARALENQCYVAVAQTIGEAPWSLAVDVNYGFAAFYSTPDVNLPEDGILGVYDAPQLPGWLLQELDFSKIEYVRDYGQVFNFKDQQKTGYTHDASNLAVQTLRC